MKRYLKQYLWVGLAVLLIAAALFVPQGWFIMRDAASLNRTHGEELSLLMVAQLDRSYERDVHERMTVYMDAAAGRGDVMCSSKEIDPANESLWENIGQTEENLLMQILRDYGFVPSEDKKELELAIESCTQYVLMRKSDGQILLVVNDIWLSMMDDSHMELLLDGVDGTIYYLESEEHYSGYRPKLTKMDDYYAWTLWWVLNDVYQTENTLPQNEGAAHSVGDTENAYARQTEAYESYIMKQALYGNLSVSEMEEWLALYGNLSAGEGEAADTARKQYFNDGDTYAEIWVSTMLGKDIYCCLLPFGELSVSWSMEVEMPEDGEFLYRIRLGLPGVVNAIPEMAERISLAEYFYKYT